MRNQWLAAVAFAMANTTLPALAQPASGPLRVHPTNPRYFADAQGRGVYLTGSHTWSNFQDSWTKSSPITFDFDAYLDLLEENNHNFIRLWHAEMPALQYEGGEEHYTSPHPWRRTGPGLAGDGEPKFNLHLFEQAYFDRLRERCIAAGQRGIYVSIMLFEGYALTHADEGWFSHPFNVNNNVNGIDGDIDGSDSGEETHTLQVPDVLVVQAAYARKVIDTVNDLDNIMYEIANESHGQSVAWQEHCIAEIRAYQSTKPQQHLIWFTTPLANVGSALWNSDAEVVSPNNNNGAYQDNPPINDGEKIIITDTDHLWGCGGHVAWVWKSFTRGLHPIYMDSYYDDSSGCPPPDLEIRRAMGHTRSYALRMNLANCIPSTTLANSGYCLADANDAYLVYDPSGGSVSLNLSNAKGSFNVEWFDPERGEVLSAPATNGGESLNFSAPFSGHSVLFVYRPAPKGGGDGDINNDGEIGVDDLLQVLADWGDCSGCLSDANADGVVDTLDLLIVVENWGWTIASEADVTGDGQVDVDDLILVMSNWGACPGCPADATDDGVVDVDDLLLVLENWGWGSSVNIGDVNHDGSVDVDDLLQVLINWGSCFGCMGDANGDGVVNIDDLLLVVVNWGG